MALSHPDLLSSGCPSAEVLEAFYLGQLAEPELELLAEHIATCPACSTLLESLDQQRQPADDLLGQMRQCQPAHTLFEEPGYVRLEAAARALPLSAGSTISTADSPGSLAPRTDGAADTGEVPALALPETVGPYEVLAKLGEGGMGVVYKARQCPVNRLVALKMILTGAHAGTHARARFNTEGQAIARLHHPHVVQIYEFGTHQGLPYYSMELLEGGTLAQRLRQDPVAPREAAALVQKLAGAVAYAHQAQVLHRDLKPANILLTAEGEPKIADFGLAKLLDEPDGHTCSNLVLGTPSYMAPEQAEARQADIGPATDVYALGAILYQALTGHPPFHGKDRADTLRCVLHAPLERPSRRRAVPPVLEAICLKCLEKAPARRYASAQALADDLDCFLRGEPTVARPLRWPAQLGRRLQRHAVALGLVAVLAVMLAVVYWRQPQRRLEQIERDLQRGRPVTLIGASGQPSWFRWLRGEAGCTLNEAEDHTCQFGSAKVDNSLLELVPDPCRDSYRITAQVRHVSGNGMSRCGLYFGHRTAPGPQGQSISGLLATFHGIYSSAETISRVRANLPPKVLKQLQQLVLPGNTEQNPVGLLGYYHPDGFASPRHTTTFSSKATIVPETLGGRAWHELEITVTPHTLRFLIDGQSATTLSAADFAQAQAGARRPVEQHGIPRRGSLGLYVSNGFATFREVVVTPLDEAP